MFRLKLILIVVGGVLAFMGYEEFVVSQKTSDTAMEIALADIEKNQALDNYFVNVGPHWAVYPGLIYNYEASKYGSDEPKDSSKVNFAYYPIVSNDHPYVVATDALMEKYGSAEAIPDEAWPAFKQFAVLVKTKRFKTVGQLPEDWGEEAYVEGLVVNVVDPLDTEESNLIRQSFPGIDLQRVLILEQGRTPSSSMQSIGMMAGGGILAILGLFLMIPRGRKE